MGTVRTCDHRCHKARCVRCVCWCGGLFHGAGGKTARDVFVKNFGQEIPATEEERDALLKQPGLFGDPADRWRRAWEVAVQTRQNERP